MDKFQYPQYKPERKVKYIGKHCCSATPDYKVHCFK